MGLWNLGDYFFDSHSAKPARRAAKRRNAPRFSPKFSRRLFECLEQRQMLTITASYNAGTMTETFTGTSPTDLLELSIVGAGGDAISYDIGGGTVTQPNVAHVVFGGAGGATRFIIHGQTTADTFTFTNPFFPQITADHMDFIWLGVQKVFVDGGDGADTFNVQATGTETHILGEGGDDIINVSSDAGLVPGNQGNLQGILAPLFVDGGIGANTMVVSDYGETVTANNNVSINATEIDNFAGPTNNVSIGYAATGGTLQLELDGSNSAAAMFGDKFHVIATSPNVHTTLKGNAGDDFFFVGNVLSNITGAVKIIGGGDAGDATQIDDTGRNTATNYVITSSNITVDGHTIVDGFDTANLEFDGTTGENHFTVTPNHVTKFLIDGKAPEPGDSLTVNIAGTAGAMRTLDPMTPGSGKWTFTDGTMEVDFKNISTSGIEAILAYGAGASNTSQPIVKIVDAATGTATGLAGSLITPYGAFKGGVHVALGDVNGDGIPDLIAAPGRGLEPVVKVYDLLTGTLIEQFDVYTPKFRGGVNVALGDLNHDGFNDLVVSPTLGKATIQTFINTKTPATPFGPLGAIPPHATAPILTPTTQFLAFAPKYVSGANIVVNDVLLTGTSAQIIVGSGPGMPATVNIFPGNATGPTNAALAPLATFQPFVKNFRGGVSVASMGAIVTVGAGIGGHSTIQEYTVLPGPTVTLAAQIINVFLDSKAPLQIATNHSQFIVAQGNDAPSATQSIIATPNFSGMPPFSTTLLTDATPPFAGGFFIALDVDS